MTPVLKNVPTSKNNVATGAVDTPPATAPKRPVWEVVVEIGAQIPEEEWAKVPDDASINYKHYLYGTPPQHA